MEALCARAGAVSHNLSTVLTNVQQTSNYMEGVHGPSVKGNDRGRLQCRRILWGVSAE